MNNTAVVTNGDIDGNVSNCQLTEKMTNMSYKSAFSITGEFTTSVMNSCTGEIISEYTYKGLTEFGIVTAFVLGIILVASICTVIANRY